MNKLCYGGIVTAAGLSSRMGDLKPLLPYGKATIIEAVLICLQDAGVDEIVVVLGHRGREIQDKISGSPGFSSVRFVYNQAYRTSDMFCSVKLGIASLLISTSFFILPADMPGISSGTLRDLISEKEQKGAKVAVPSYKGKRSHPPLIDMACAKCILEYGGDGGLRGALSALEDRTVSVDTYDFGCTINSNTRVEYERLLAYRQSAFHNQTYFIE